MWFVQNQIQNGRSEVSVIVVDPAPLWQTEKGQKPNKIKGFA
jgi:hypothetical protein